MQIFLGLLGLSLIILTFADFLWTTLTLDGGGFLTVRVAKGLWGVLLYRHRSSSSHRLLATAGLIIILTTITLWVTLVWLGWALVFNASDQAIVNAETAAPADVWDRIYFTGFTLFTLGVGDFRPQGPFWQILTAIAAANGFFLVTLAVTYLVPIMSAATQKRQLAIYIFSMGRTADEVILRAWNGRNFSSLEPHLVSLTPMLALHGQRHLTYPILHYFHSSRQHTAAAVSFAVLDEALTLLEFGVKPECQIDPLTLYVIRQTMQDFLETLGSAFISPTDELPPIPSLVKLRAQGVPTVSDETFQAALNDVAKRRQLLLALVRNDGWSWSDVY